MITQQAPFATLETAPVGRPAPRGRRQCAHVQQMLHLFNPMMCGPGTLRDAMYHIQAVPSDSPSFKELPEYMNYNQDVKYKIVKNKHSFKIQQTQ